LLYSPIFCFLVLDILSNGVLVATNCRNEVTPGPKRLPREVLLLAKESPRYVDGTLPLYETDYLSNSELGRDRQQHMHVIRLKMALLNLAFLSVGKVPKNRTKFLSQLPEQGLASIFGDEDHVILALPTSVT